MRTQDFVQGNLGLYDGVLGQGVMVKQAVVDTSGTARADTGLFLPEGSKIVGMRAIVGAQRFTAATNLSVGHVSDDDAFAGNIALGTVANTTATFGDSQFSGKVSAIQSVGANTSLFTKLSRAQANADLILEVSYVNPVIEVGDEFGTPAGTSPNDYTDVIDDE